MKPTQNKIDAETVRIVRSLKPRRICFATYHKNALKPSNYGSFEGNFSVPFRESFYPIFHETTEIELKYSEKYDNYWTGLSGEQCAIVEKFTEDSGELVYLRDTLALSIALSEHMVDENTRTEMGELLIRAKYDSDEDALNELAKKCYEINQRLPFYKEVTTYCAVPSSKKDKNSLPVNIVNIISKNNEIDDITRKVQWFNEKHYLKDTPLENKWEALETAGLEVKEDLTGKTIILIDDMYQSGCTMQFVAMKLQEAGAASIYGLVVCKSRRDSDNQ